MDRFEQLFVTCMSTPLSTGAQAPHKSDCLMGINLNVIGGSGVGKSKRLYNLGNLMGVPVFPIFTSTKTPEHIGGFPVMTPHGFTLECALPQVRAAIDAGRAIIFLDEIGSAPRAVQAALLSFVNERTIGEYMLPRGVRIVLAMNPADVSANGRDLEIPMANRVLHFQYQPPSLSQWFDFMEDSYDPGVPNLIDSEDIVKREWRNHFSTTLGATRDFLEASGGTIKEKDEDGELVSRSKFYDQPSSDSDRASGPWPSHRTWHAAVNGVVTARCLDMPMSVQTDIIEGLIGKGIAAEWTAYMKKMNLPKPKDVLTAELTQHQWPIPKQLDIVRLVLMSATSYAAQETDLHAKTVFGLAALMLLERGGTAGYWDLCVRPFGTLLRAGFDLTHPDLRIQQAAEQIATPLTAKGFLKYIR